SAPVDLDDWYIAGSQHVCRTRVHAESEDRWVFEEPDLVGSRGIALIGEALHGAPRRLVLEQAHMADDGRGERPRRPQAGCGSLSAHALAPGLARPAASPGTRAAIVQPGIVTIERLLGAIARAYQRSRNTLEEAARERELAIAIELRGRDEALDG